MHGLIVENTLNAKGLNIMGRLTASLVILCSFCAGAFAQGSDNKQTHPYDLSVRGPAINDEEYMAQVYAYCKAWADDPTSRPSAFSYQDAIFSTKSDCPVYVLGSVQLEGYRWFTEAEAAIGRAQRKKDLLRAGEEVKESDAEQAEQVEEKRKVARAEIDRIGLRLGQSQALVKSLLVRVGFKMPWACSGGDAGDGTWQVGCTASRGKEKVLVWFTVYRRVRYTDPDTAVPTIVREKVDKAIIIGYVDDTRGIMWQEPE